MNHEPVAIGGALGALATAILAVLVGTGTITTEMSGLLLGVVTAFIVVVTSVVRSKVSPVASLQNQGETK